MLGMLDLLSETVAELEEELHEGNYEEAKASLDFIITIANGLKGEL